MSIETELEERTKQSRTRWLRWLGQKTRSDNSSWVELFSSNYSGWASKVLENHDIIKKSFCVWRPGEGPPLREIKEYFSAAINCASLFELSQLDELYVSEQV